MCSQVTISINGIYVYVDFRLCVVLHFPSIRYGALQIVVVLLLLLLVLDIAVILIALHVMLVHMSVYAALLHLQIHL